ncbi:hypothetical protein DND90_00410 [Pseudomonas syringae pv. maculicola]|nr:hypothetical protein DND90_00410 [Pseudomonas syringae pv. maculicola]
MKRTKSHDGKGEYDHEVRLTIAEVAAIIEKLAGPGLAEFEGSVSEGLSGSVRSLHRLTAAASGIKFCLNHALAIMSASAISQKNEQDRLCENTLMKAQANAPTCSGRFVLYWQQTKK